MSLDINWIILIVVFAALVIEVLAAVVYVFENCWTFDTPRTRTLSGGKAIQDFRPDAYTAVWSSEVIGAVEKKQSDAIQGKVDPLAPSFGQKHQPLPRTRPANHKSTPDNGLLFRCAARISSWMTALAPTATAKPMHDAGNIETQSPSHTQVEPAVGTCTMTDSSLASQRRHPQDTMSGLACSSDVVAFRGIEVRMPANMSASTSLPRGIAPAGATRLLMVPKVLKVFAVEGLHAPRYQSRPPTVRVSTGVVDRARSPVSIEGWGGSFTRASLKRSKTPYHPARLSEVGTKEVPQVLKDARAISSSTTPAAVHLEPEARPVGKSHSVPVFTPHAEPVSIIPAKRRLRAGVLET
ncbi:putative transmembrane protein, partial [Rhizoctonia solani 123E]